ncbi:MAG: hypothetical protein JRJ87_05970 [Deltaproteobacteria bacterium]|nr:hypothetical protein [Deltaproteobacteria bacterium]
MKPPQCMATMIGSLPHKDPERAVQLVLAHLSEAPIWPELPNRSFFEDMVHAHTAGLPGLVVDEQAHKMYIDTSLDHAAELAGFYEKTMAAEASGDLEEFAMHSKYASAMEIAALAFERAGRIYPIIKVHCIGPVSFQLGLKDAQGKALFYDETFQEVLTRQICLQARWIARRFSGFGETTLAFLDEPSLAAFGSSSFLGVMRADVVARLGTAVAALKSEGAKVGVHVCGNTDWPMIIEAGADLLNYDAYEYGSSMLVYADQIGPYLERGGIIAWGIVPNNDKVRTESVQSLKDRFFSLVDGLVAAGVDRQLVLDQSMLTPACGLAPLSVEDAEHAIKLLAELAASVQAIARN